MPLYIPTGTLSGSQTVTELNATTALKLNGESFPSPDKIPTLDSTPVFTTNIRVGEDGTYIETSPSAINITDGATTLQINATSINCGSAPISASDFNGNLLWIRSTRAGSSINIGGESMNTIDITLSDGSIMTVVDGVK